MIATINDGYFDINYRISGQDTSLHCTFDTLFNGRDKLLGNISTNNLRDECEARTTGSGSYTHNNVTILSTAARLFGMLILSLCRTQDCLPIRNARLAGIDVDTVIIP